MKPLDVLRNSRSDPSRYERPRGSLQTKSFRCRSALVGRSGAVDCFHTAITQAEILYGIERLPAGKRRVRLAAAMERMFAEDFIGRIFPFDEHAARTFAEIVARRETAGRPISQFDAMIAVITRSRRATLATRNVSDFEGCGISIVNPWLD